MEYREISPDAWRKLFLNFIELGPPHSGAAERQASLLRLVTSSDVGHQSFEVNAQDFIDYSPKYAPMVLRYPDALLDLCAQGVIQAQQRLLASDEMQARLQEANPVEALINPPFSVKEKLTVRFTYLPPFSEFCKPNISCIRSKDTNGLIQLSGTVIRSGLMKMLEYQKCYVCDKCSHEFIVSADIEQWNLLEEPKICPMIGDSNNACKSTKFTLKSTECTDYQEIKIQEHVQSLSVGSIPRSLVVILEHDLVDLCKAGDDITAVGRLIRRWKPVQKEVKCQISIVLRANSLRVSNDTSGVASLGVSPELSAEFEELWSEARKNNTPLKMRDFIVKSVCPQIYGLFTVKLCLLLTLIGGVPSNTDEEGMPVRAQSHLLIVGDPGTGKSQFLRFADRVSPRCVLTTGVGTTSAGLTCSAVRDNGEWTLEAGALVLADRGVCCIDEFSSIREADRATIHEAMEQQTLSVAKAGLVCKLNARTTVIAVTNPKGAYDTSQDISVNTAIASPLLSRFDIILVLLDTSNKEWDLVVSTFILRQACGMSSDKTDNPVESVVKVEDSDDDGVDVDDNDDDVSYEQASRATVEFDEEGGVVSSSLQRPPHGKNDRYHRHNGRNGLNDSSKKTKHQQHTRSHNSERSIWGIEKLRKYLTYCKTVYKPTLSKDASDVLSRYWELQRSNEMRNAARTTVRMLESLVRLAEAHARLCFRQEVGVVDAVVAVQVVEMSMMTSSLLQLDNVLHSDFPKDPDADFLLLERLVLDKLQLHNTSSSNSPFSQSTGTTRRRSFGSGGSKGEGMYSGLDDVYDEEENDHFANDDGWGVSTQINESRNKRRNSSSSQQNPLKKTHNTQRDDQSQTPLTNHRVGGVSGGGSGGGGGVYSQSYASSTQRDDQAQTPLSNHRVGGGGGGGGVSGGGGVYSQSYASSTQRDESQIPYHGGSGSYSQFTQSHPSSQRGSMPSSWSSQKQPSNMSAEATSVTSSSSSSTTVSCSVCQDRMKGMCRACSKKKPKGQPQTQNKKTSSVTHKHHQQQQQRYQQQQKQSVLQSGLSQAQDHAQVEPPPIKSYTFFPHLQPDNLGSQ